MLAVSAASFDQVSSVAVLPALSSCALLLSLVTLGYGWRTSIFGLGAVVIVSLVVFAVVRRRLVLREVP